MARVGHWLRFWDRFVVWLPFLARLSCRARDALRPWYCSVDVRAVGDCGHECLGRGGTAAASGSGGAGGGTIRKLSNGSWSLMLCSVKKTFS